MTNDSREAAMRYRLRKEAVERGEEPPDDDDPAASRIWSEAERAAIVEVSIEQAIRRGDFDNLPGAGKPIPGLGHLDRSGLVDPSQDRTGAPHRARASRADPAHGVRVVGRPARRAAHRGRGARIPLRLQSPRDRGTSAAARRPAGGHTDRRDRRVGARLEGTSGCRRPPHRGAVGDADQTAAELAFLAGRSLTRAAGLELGVQLALQPRDIHLSTQIGGRQHRGGAPGGDRRAEGRRQIAPLGEPQHQRAEE